MTPGEWLKLIAALALLAAWAWLFTGGPLGPGHLCGGLC